ncbi:MAG: S9 family peptidase, partial [Myxococcota bacterium]|nr:S9 family peptidase [Myxococcota bacterium]
MVRCVGLLSTMCLTAAASAAEAPVPDPGYLRRHAETRGFSLGRPVQPRPTPDGQAVLFLRSGPRSPTLSLYEFAVASGQTRELVRPEQLLRGAEEQLSTEEKARRERMRMSLRGFTQLELSPDGTLVLLPLSGRLYLLNRKTGTVTELRTGPTPALDPHLSPDGRRVAYVRDRDLYVYDLATEQERRLVASRHPQVSYGLAEFIAQEELHRHQGLFWSPDGQQLAFEEADHRGVELLHIADPARPEQPPTAFPYPRPGRANAKVRLGLISVTGGRPTWVRWDADRLPYLATVRWDKNAPLTLVVLSRDQHDLEVLEVTQGGRTRTLLREHDPAWLNVDQDVPRWLPDGSGFLWTSERSGQRELELRDRSGQLVRVLVPGSAGYQKLIDVDGQRVVFAAAADPAVRDLFWVPLGGGPAQPLPPQVSGPAVRGATFSRDHSLYVHTWTSPQSMTRTTVHRADGTLVGELDSVAEEPPFRPRLELSWAGPQRLRASILRPRDHRPGRRYPVVVSVYGGPGHTKVSAAMHGYLLDQWLADHGYIVVSADGRGTPGRGREFERALAGSFARTTVADQVEALQALAQHHPEMDLTRVGIYGWSFGGYLAALAVLLRPDVFHVAVAGAPVVDWLDYDTCYTERYLGLPADNPAGYADSSLLTHAAKLVRPLLIIHGTSDDNVYFFHALKLSNALFRAGRDHELLPLVGLTHMVPEPLVTERLWERILATLSRTLRPTA